MKQNTVGAGPPVPPIRKPGQASLRRGRVSLPGHAYFVTASTHKRQPLFANFDAACAASQVFADQVVLADARFMAWVLMPDHFHGLLKLGNENDLPSIMNRLKSASARHANKVLGRQGPLWERAYYDHALRDEDDLIATARYIVVNPLRAGLVRTVGDYPFWNAIWLP